MVNYKPSAASSVVAAIVTIILLLFIFVLPTMTVNDIADKVLPAARETIKAVLTKDWDRAVEQIDYAADVLDENEKIMMLFIDHQLIDELIAAAQGTQHLVRMHDEAQVFTELEFIINRMNYLREAESFTLGNLL